MTPVFSWAARSCTAAAFSEVQGHSRPCSCVYVLCANNFLQLSLTWGGTSSSAVQEKLLWFSAAARQGGGSPPSSQPAAITPNVLNLCSEIWTALSLDGVSDGPNMWVFINNNSNLCVKDLRGLLFIHVPLSVSRYCLFPFLIPNLSNQKDQCCHQL